jgi:hypothetical protein
VKVGVWECVAVRDTGKTYRYHVVKVFLAIIHSSLFNEDRNVILFRFPSAT